MKGRTAVSIAADLVSAIESEGAQLTADPEFGLPPKMTVTMINAGESYSTIPSECTVAVDVRLTPKQNSDWAHQKIYSILERIGVPSKEKSMIIDNTWPAYKLSKSNIAAKCLLDAAKKNGMAKNGCQIVGPSNIGNFFSVYGIQAVCGFGTEYANIHSENEWADLSMIENVFETYKNASINFLRQQRVNID